MHTVSKTSSLQRFFYLYDMPVIKIFCSELPNEARCESLAQTLDDLCIRAMGAHPDAIQLLLIDGVKMLSGEKVFVEAHYRDRPDRHGVALTQFLTGIDRAVQQAFGLSPRIRSFAVDQSTLGAVR